MGLIFFIKTCALQLHVKHCFVGQMTSGVLQDIKDCQIHPDMLFHLFSVQQANRRSCQEIPTLPSKPDFLSVEDGVDNFTVTMYINERRCESCESTSSSATGNQLHLYTYLHMQCYNDSLLLTRSKFT